MFGKLAGLPARRAAKSRWLGGTTVIASCATLAVLSGGGAALASPAGAKAATTTGTIKACYLKGTKPVAMKHIPTSAKCPTGNATLKWNKVGPQGPAGPTGPQGPAGVSVGTSGSSSTAVSLAAPQSLTPVLGTAAVPSSGTYYVSASVMLIVAQGDQVACILSDQLGEQGEFATVGTAPNQAYATIPLSAEMSVSAGDHPEVYCTGYSGSAVTEFYDGAITATLINSPTGNAHPAAAARPALPPGLPPAR